MSSPRTHADAALAYRDAKDNHDIQAGNANAAAAAEAAAQAEPERQANLPKPTRTPGDFRPKWMTPQTTAEQNRRIEESRQRAAAQREADSEAEREREAKLPEPAVVPGVIGPKRVSSRPFDGTRDEAVSQ